MRIRHDHDIPPITEPEAPVPIPAPLVGVWPGHEKFCEWLAREMGAVQLVHLNRDLDDAGFSEAFAAALVHLPDNGLVLHRATTTKRWAELKAEHKGRYFEFRHGAGLGIIAPKAGPLPPEVDRIFKMDYAAQVMFRAQYDDFLSKK